MAGYQQLVIEQFKEQDQEQRLNLRKTNDLPVEIIGNGAFLHKPGPSPQGNDRPPSYHIIIDNIYHLVEFENKQWCYLVWDDVEKYRVWNMPTK